MVVRCTSKLLDLLGKRSVRLVEAPPSDDDWYANLLWLDRRKCLLITHAGTLFSLSTPTSAPPICARSSAASPNSSRLRLLDDGLPSDALGRLAPDEVQIARTASKHVLGVMDQMAFEIEWAVDQAGGLWNVDIGDLNRHLRRSR